MQALSFIFLTIVLSGLFAGKKNYFRETASRAERQRKALIGVACLAKEADLRDDRAVEMKNINSDAETSHTSPQSLRLLRKILLLKSFV
jgi:hypothetical protein